MSLNKFIAFVTGIGIGLALTAIVLPRLKNREWQQDERAGLVHAKAGQWSFYISLAVVALLWLIASIRQGVAEGTVQFFSPLGIACWSMLGIYVLTAFYHHHSSSGDLLTMTAAEQRVFACILLVGSLALSVLTMSERAFLYVQIVMFLSAIGLFYRSSQTKCVH